MVGSYELRDLDHAAVGLLYEGKLIIDKTYGHASYGCGTCCGYVKAQVWVTPFSGPPSINNTDYYQAEEQCGGAWDDFTSIATSWQSSNTAVATLPSRTLHTVAPGTATGSAEAYLQGSRPAPACPMIWMAGQQQLNVVTVAISLNSTGQCSSYDSARDQYYSSTGTFNLGVQTSTKTGFKACFGGVELKGAVNPASYPSLLELRRSILSCGTYMNSSNSQSCPTGDDTSTSLMRDDNPSISGGNIYDLDTPGVKNGTQANSVYRYRVNFSEYATLSDGKTVVSTAPLNYYVRISCTFDANGNPSLDTTVSGDNQIGLGTTKTSWNLQ